ncbi:MAG: RNA polymerase sigma factor [Eubacteriales bacterium]
MEDQAIVELYFARSESAIDECERKYGRYCFAVADSILSDSEDARECVNDLWLRVWNSIPPHRPENLKTFCGKIVRNLAIDRYRLSRTRQRGGGEYPLALEEIADCIPDRTGEVESAFDEKALSDALNRFLATLPADTRRIFLSRYWHLKPIKEISDEHGCGESRVKMVLLRTREKLKKFLTEEGIEF